MIPIRRIICLFSILALFCVAGIHGADAEVHTVAPMGAEFTSIQAAIDWAYSWRHSQSAKWYLH